MDNTAKKSGFNGKQFVIWMTALILGVILPIYTIIDMIETAVNVWSDACVCAIVDKSINSEKTIKNNC